MHRRSDSRQRMLDAAADLFQAQGYHATGLNQLVSAGGAPKGSLYFHFPGGKEQLAAEAVTASGSRLRERLAELMAAAPDPAAGIAAVVDALAGGLAASGFTHGCPIATVALDTAGESEVIRDACSGTYDSWRSAIAGYLVEHGVDPGRAGDLGAVVLASIEGALLLARTGRDVAPLRAVGEHLRRTIEEELA